MHNIWGVMIAIVGLLMLLGGLTKTDFVLYRILAARSRLLWGDNVHSFYIVVGLMVALFGVLVTTGVIRR